MKTLVSMTDFVLSQWEKTPEIPTQTEACKLLMINKKYAEFLKQPLTLGMFVPCDKNGNILKEPKTTVFQDANFDIDEVNIYQEAKEKVLFKGFSPCKVNGFQVTYKKKDGITFNLLIDGTIEDIIFLINEKFELTESALKQIGLNP